MKGMVSNGPRWTDPVLHHFQVEPALFNLGGHQDPVAIRDQQMRACLAVDRAVDAGLLNSDDRLAVIGAGAAGTSAALRAAWEYGIQTVLFDEAAEPLLNHPYRCQTRRVDPTLYDWPATHWREQQFPLPGTPAVPLGWKATTPALVAAQWRRLWGTIAPSLIRQGVLAFQPLTRIDTCQRQGTSILRPNQEGPFNLVIAACGRGSERTWLGGADEPTDYSAYHFWQNDRVEWFNYGKGSRTIPERHIAVLSGGGDGAMQDLLRLVFRDPQRKPGPFYAGDLLQALEDAITNAAGVGPWATLRWKVAVAEDRALRAKAWVAHNGQEYDRQQDTVALMRLNDEYQEAIEELLDNVLIARAISHTLAMWCREDFGEVHLVSRQQYCFSWGYAINRLLTKLVLGLADRQTAVQGGRVPTVWRPARGKSIFFWVGASIADIAPLDHPSCQPGLCGGGRHEVRLERNDGTPLAPIEADLILIRHGLVSPPGIVGVPDVALGRQALPYTLPG
jgi:hypothetical protein